MKLAKGPLLFLKSVLALLTLAFCIFASRSVFMLCFICIILSVAAGSFAAVLEKLTVQAIRMKAENEMTV
ncbi:hypothetical protein QOZ98_001460 [Planomicrobium stackebrandtii]|uniref:DUF2721 domain-containing protein n=1 Tax=Planomicrobium stackebrandtii TaxID=253160 RepID=A0ABU0GUJ9_9BACL|nr:DUF2975 domain-containing protein [Planomicrobium stackebrandtii]MDQ0428634.1 hypothetical protein [Planomicrobium stackebrandtii]